MSKKTRRELKALRERVQRLEAEVAAMRMQSPITWTLPNTPDPRYKIWCSSLSRGPVTTFNVSPDNPVRN